MHAMQCVIPVDATGYGNNLAHLWIFDKWYDSPLSSWNIKAQHTKSYSAFGVGKSIQLRDRLRGGFSC